MSTPLSKEQESETAAGWKTHPVDYRISCNLLGSQVYIVFLMGYERRSNERIATDGQLRDSSVILTKLLLIAIAGCGLLFTLLGFVVATLYLLKSGMGIDMFHGESFLHAWFL